MEIEPKKTKERSIAARRSVGQRVAPRQLGGTPEFFLAILWFRTGVLGSSRWRSQATSSTTSSATTSSTTTTTTTRRRRSPAKMNRKPKPNDTFFWFANNMKIKNRVPTMLSNRTKGKGVRVRTRYRRRFYCVGSYRDRVN